MGLSEARTGLAWAAVDRERSSAEDVTLALEDRFPSRARLRHPFGVWDQRELPCCVSCSIVAAMEILDARRGRAVRLSPLFNYYFARPSPSRLVDVRIGAGLVAARDHGVAPLVIHAVEFTEPGAQRVPTRTAKLRAAGFRLQAPRRRRRPTPAFLELPDPESVEAWKSALMKGCPLILGFALGPAYDRLRQPGESVIRSLDTGDDGHCVVVLGYDDNGLGPDEGAFLVKDSRGPSLGAYGTWWLPYSLVEWGFARELWVTTDISYDA